MIDFLTAGERRHSNKKAERKDTRNAASMGDYALRRKRREARGQGPGVARREEEGGRRGTVWIVRTGGNWVANQQFLIA